MKRSGRAEIGAAGSMKFSSKSVFLLLVSLLSTFEFGALTEFEEWVTVCQKMIDKIEKAPIIRDDTVNCKDQGATVDALQKLKEELNSLQKKVNDFMAGKSMPRNLFERLERPIENAKAYFKQLKKGVDDFGWETDQKYLDNLVPRIRSQILGLRAEFGTLAMEFQLKLIDQKDWRGGQDKADFEAKLHQILAFLKHNKTHCAEEPFEHAKAKIANFNEQEANEKLQNLVKMLILEANLSILENELVAKTHAFQHPQIDVSGFINFALQCHSELKRIKSVVADLPNDLEHQEFLKKLDAFPERAQEITQQLKLNILKELDELKHKISSTFNGVTDRQAVELCDEVMAVIRDICLPRLEIYMQIRRIKEVNESTICGTIFGKERIIELNDVVVVERQRQKVRSAD
uniref:Secreted protein n=1 Tax=Globodera rostochiensis TaxID=31243 RepID=A0A914HPL3_GLORO